MYWMVNGTLPPASSRARQRRGTSRSLSPHQVPRKTITSAPGSTAASPRAASASTSADTEACTQEGCAGSICSRVTGPTSTPPASTGAASSGAAAPEGGSSEWAAGAIKDRPRSEVMSIRQVQPENFMTPSLSHLGRALDPLDPLDAIIRLDAVQHLVSTDHLPEDRIAPVQVRLR